MEKDKWGQANILIYLRSADSLSADLADVVDQLDWQVNTVNNVPKHPNGSRKGDEDFSVMMIGY